MRKFFSDTFSCFFNQSYRRYNNDNIGNTILDLRKQGVIDTETLQHFVLDIWNYQLEKNNFVQGNTINILERLPDDAIYCFSKEAYEQNIISQESYFNLCIKYQNIFHQHIIWCKIFYLCARYNNKFLNPLMDSHFLPPVSKKISQKPRNFLFAVSY